MLSVLVVEDHQAVREALVAAFLGWGHPVASAATLQEALALVDARSFNLVVTDVDLGGANGLDLVRSMRTSQPEVLFIVMSGRFGLKDILGSGIEAGDTLKYLRKPFLLSQLQAAIGELVQRNPATAR